MWVLKLDGVTKYHRSRGIDTVRSDLGRMARRLRGNDEPRTRPQPRPALDDVSFEIEHGSAVSLVGANGAGKSTALRLLSRITYPTEGQVRVRGRVGALLEVGSGVHPELSGRENIWLYGSIIGMSRSQIRRSFDDIVAFSELQAAIDKQTKFYSSGMQLRLGFAIATFLEPQTLLVDESLATADVAFQRKSLARLTELVRQGTTLVFVSHEAAAVEALCTRALLLERGRLVHDGPTVETLAEYRRRLEAEQDPAAVDDTGCRIVHVACLTHDGRPATEWVSGEGLVIEVAVDRGHPGPSPVVDVRITDGRSAELFVASSDDDGVAVPGDIGRHVLHCCFDALPLRPRTYRVWVSTRRSEQAPGDAGWTEAAVFRVRPPDGAPVESADVLRGGPLAVRSTWSVSGS
jgi:ABC-type polysaccharide/polyol phosphate transport system ATPase subunit